MFRAPLAALLLLAASGARAFEEPAVADRNLPAILRQLETGDWNARIHAVHELDYMREEGLPGLERATKDGDWQVRMAAVHSLSSRGSDAAKILNSLLKHEPCPVVRLMTLHSLGSLGPEGEEAKAMGALSDTSGRNIACVDQDAPGLASWAKGKAEAKRSAPPAPAPPAKAPQPEPEPEPVVTRDPVPPKPAPARAKRPAEDLPAPPPSPQRPDLDAILDARPAKAAPRRGVELAMRARSTGTPENLPWPVAPVPREHEVTAPGLLMEDKGGKTAYDALPALMGALKKGDPRARARAADDLGHMGAKAAPAVQPLIAALGDRNARVRASAGLALGNIGAEAPSVVPLLKKALKDRSEDVRYAAALALSRIETRGR